jgi:hypothetical protein
MDSSPQRPVRSSAARYAAIAVMAERDQSRGATRTVICRSVGPSKRV